MQGPIPPDRGRRAGDSAGMPGSPDGNLKDWQKNTAWFGPIPSDTNPFEEPEDAPELRELRSSNVSDHSGDFWSDRQQTGYQYSLGKKKETGKAYTDTRQKERRVSLRAFAVLALLLVTAVLVMYFGVFRIREIRVEGNSVISAADVIRFSGIRKGGSILQLSETETEKRLVSAALKAASDTGNYNYNRLQFRYLEKELPGTVIISVRERETCCYVTWCGIIYAMDKTGMVLYETEDTAMREQMKLVEVKGLDIRSGAHVGQTLVMSSAAQAQVFRDLFMELKVVGYTENIAEADLSNLSSIILTTRDNFTVGLGGSEYLHAKLRSMKLVCAKLLEMGKTGGSVNVSKPEEPSYSPDSPQ